MGKIRTFPQFVLIFLCFFPHFGPSGGQLSVVASRGAWGAFAPSWRLCPPLAPPQSEEKNGQNQPFLAYFWISAPSESHFAPAMSPPTKKFLVPPLAAFPSGKTLAGYIWLNLYMWSNTGEMLLTIVLVKAWIIFWGTLISRPVHKDSWFHYILFHATWSWSTYKKCNTNVLVDQIDSKLFCFFRIHPMPPSDLAHVAPSGSEVT